jgi:hypothetical protein
MKKILFVVLSCLLGMNLFSRDNSSLKFIFIPHPRTDDNVHQSVIPGIAKIDFTKFDVKMLGGDITYYTSKNSATLSYVDSLFDLGNLNTLWSFGNHDVENGNRALIKQFTGRDSYYAYYRDGVTFIILDTELDAIGFDATYIKGDQLQLVKNVCDTITESKFLILLHSRFMWMINNDYFKSKLSTDSIAASTRSMTETNFYTDIYPLLQKVIARGIQVKVFGGDKSKINITYSPEDSITFYAARMSNDLADSVNNVIIMDYSLEDNSLNCNYVPLDNLNKTNNEVDAVNYYRSDQPLLFVWQTSGIKEINVRFQTEIAGLATLKIYNVNGELYQSINCKTNEMQTVHLNRSGIYIVKACMKNSILIKKFVLQ